VLDHGALERLENYAASFQVFRNDVALNQLVVREDHPTGVLLEEKLSDGRVLSLPDLARQEAESFVAELDALARDVGVRAILHSKEVPSAALPELAREAVSIRRLMDPNPREITEADAVEIYRAALS